MIYLKCVINLTYAYIHETITPVKIANIFITIKSFFVPFFFPPASPCTPNSQATSNVLLLKIYFVFSQVLCKLNHIVFPAWVLSFRVVIWRFTKVPVGVS